MPSILIQICSRSFSVFNVEREWPEKLWTREKDDDKLFQPNTKEKPYKQYKPTISQDIYISIHDYVVHHAHIAYDITESTEIVAYHHDCRNANNRETLNNHFLERQPHLPARTRFFGLTSILFF